MDSWGQEIIQRYSRQEVEHNMQNPIIPITLLIIIFAGCISGSTAPEPAVNNTTQPIVPTPALPLRQHGIFQQYATAHGITLAEAQTFFQNTYGINEEDIFAQLPLPSETFLVDVNTLHYGNGETTNLITPQSYLQPEFYPTFTTSGVGVWKNAPEQYPNTVGLASTPADQQAELTEDTNTFSTTLFIGSAWGATYYQGIAFRYTVSPAADIQLTFNPPLVLAGPTFPTFTPEWMHKITVQGTIAPTVEEGKYTITILPADAPVPVQEEWYSTHPRYVNGNGLIAPSNGLATLTLTIPQRNNTN